MRQNEFSVHHYERVLALRCWIAADAMSEGTRAEIKSFLPVGAYVRQSDKNYYQLRGVGAIGRVVISRNIGGISRDFDRTRARKILIRKYSAGRAGGCGTKRGGMIRRGFDTSFIRDRDLCRGLNGRA